MDITLKNEGTQVSSKPPSAPNDGNSSNTSNGSNVDPDLQGANNAVCSKPPNTLNDGNSSNDSNGSHLHRHPDLQGPSFQASSKPPSAPNDGNSSNTSNGSNVDPDLQGANNEVSSKPPNAPNDGNSSNDSNGSHLHRNPDLHGPSFQVSSRPPSAPNDDYSFNTSNGSNVDPDLQGAYNEVSSKPPSAPNDENSSNDSNGSRLHRNPDLQGPSFQDKDNIGKGAKSKRHEPVTDYRLEYDKLKLKYDDLQQKYDDLQQKYDDLQQKYDGLRQRPHKLLPKDQKVFSCVSLFKQKQTVNVQMYAAVNKHLCNQIMEELEKKLSMRFEKTNISIQVQKYQDPPPKESSGDNIPLIVVCMNASRLGIDVDKALTDVIHFSTKAVVVLHHQDVHALPKVFSRDRLCARDYQHISAIVDIAYLINKGIYPCELNEKSLSSLEEFIRNAT